MRTFGGFRSQDRFFYAEVRGDQAHVLTQPYWLGIRSTGEILPLTDLQILVPVAPSKLMAVGLNYGRRLGHRSFGSKRRVRFSHTMV